MWLAESQKRFQASYDAMRVHVGIVHSAAAAERVGLRGIPGATNTTRPTTPSHSVPASRPPATKGPPRRRKPLTSNLVRVSILYGHECSIRAYWFPTSCCCDVDLMQKLKCKTETKSHLQSVLVQYTRGCCAAVHKTQKWPDTKPRRGAPRLADKRCARSSFGITTASFLPTIHLQGLR